MIKKIRLILGVCMMPFLVGCTSESQLAECSFEVQIPEMNGEKIVSVFRQVADEFGLDFEGYSTIFSSGEEVTVAQISIVSNSLLALTNMPEGRAYLVSKYLNDKFSVDTIITRLSTLLDKDLAGSASQCEGREESETTGKPQAE